MVHLLVSLLLVSLTSSALAHGKKGVDPLEQVTQALITLGYSQSCIRESMLECERNHKDNSPPDNFEFHSSNVLRSTEPLETVAPKIEANPINCADILNQGKLKSGVYTIFPNPCCPSISIQTFCEQEIDSGGWTVIQRRMVTEERENFFRSWTDYLLGFGKRDGEYWLGLKNIHTLTNSVLMELRIDLRDWENESRYVKYSSFRVKDEVDNYALALGSFEGNTTDDFYDHNDVSFSTHDNDNDKADENCASMYRSGFWYRSCHLVNLNGLPDKGNQTEDSEGINWFGWKGYEYSLKEARMMIRPVV